MSKSIWIGARVEPELAAGLDWCAAASGRSRSQELQEAVRRRIREVAAESNEAHAGGADLVNGRRVEGADGARA